jgi:hypothetical protein
MKKIGLLNLSVALATVLTVCMMPGCNQTQQKSGEKVSPAELINAAKTESLSGRMSGVIFLLPATVIPVLCGSNKKRPMHIVASGNNADMYKAGLDKSF